jgi:hypothetical protein
MHQFTKMKVRQVRNPHTVIRLRPLRNTHLHRAHLNRLRTMAPPQYPQGETICRLREDNVPDLCAKK